MGAVIDKGGGRVASGLYLCARCTFVRGLNGAVLVAPYLLPTARGDAWLVGGSLVACLTAAFANKYNGCIW